MIVTDAQVHVWEAHREDRPWPPENRGNPSFVAVPGARPHRAEPIGADEMVTMMDAAGVDRAVIVPPSPAGDSNLYALEAAQQYPDRFRVMGRFDPAAADAREQLQGWLSQPGMAGIRMTFHKPQWKHWLEPGAIDWFWADCERLGIPLMLLIPGRLDVVARVARQHPGLHLVVDHLGLHSNVRDAACEPDLDALVQLAVHPRVAVKASAVPCYTDEPYPFRGITARLERVYAAFGPRRFVWGSDVSRLPCTYRECREHFLHELPFLGEADKPWVMGKALSEVLGWAEPAHQAPRSVA